MLKIAYQLGQERALAEVGLMVKHAGIPASALEHMLLGGALGSGVGAIGGGEGHRSSGAVRGALAGAGAVGGAHLGTAFAGLPGLLGGGGLGGAAGYGIGKGFTLSTKNRLRDLVGLEEN